MNHINQQESMEQVRKQVSDLLHWKPENHSEFLWEKGIAYLFEFFNGDETVISFVSMRREFWSWWKLHWYYRDLAFIETFDLCYVHMRRIELWYRELHNPAVLAAEIFPGKVVLGNQFPIKQTNYTCRQSA